MNVSMYPSNAFEQAISLLWQQNPYLTEPEVEQLCIQRQDKLAAFLGCDASVPRSLSSGTADFLDIQNIQAPAMSRASTVSRSGPSQRRHSSKTPYMRHQHARRVSARAALPMTPQPSYQPSLDESYSCYTLSNQAADQQKSLFAPMQQEYEPDQYIQQFMGDLTSSQPTKANSFPPRIVTQQEWLSVDAPCGAYSPSSSSVSMSPLTSGVLTPATTYTGDMSRMNSSNMSSMSSRDAQDLFRQYSTSTRVSASQKQVPFSYSTVKSSDLNCFSTDGFPSAFPSLPLSNTDMQYSYSQQDGEQMGRSLSSESAASMSSAQSALRQRAHRRHTETLAQQSKQIVPKPAEQPAMLRQLSNNSIVHTGRSKPVAQITKALYVRPQHPKMVCNACTKHPEGFRGEHELRRHVERAHASVRKVFVCVLPTDPKGLERMPPVKLSDCKACRSQKKYNAYYNAAAHLRRAHFHPRPKGRRNKTQEKRGGKGGGDDPAMEYLKSYWMTELMVDVSGASQQVADDADEEEAEEEIESPTEADLPLTNNVVADILPDAQSSIQLDIGTAFPQLGDIVGMPDQVQAFEFSFPNTFSLGSDLHNIIPFDSNFPMQQFPVQGAVGFVDEHSYRDVPS